MNSEVGQETEFPNTWKNICENMNIETNSSEARNESEFPNTWKNICENMNTETNSSEAGNDLPQVNTFLDKAGHSWILLPSQPCAEEPRWKQTWALKETPAKISTCSKVNPICLQYWAQTPSPGLWHPSFNHCRI